MQLFAMDRFGHVVSSAAALKQNDYICPECGGAVRLRQGIHRKAHFFHLKTPMRCRQKGKGIVHLQVQLSLQKMLPETRLEVPFPDIGRIADVVWEREKIVFEVQCSPISAEEVLDRNEDYFRMGYQVVWVLHDRRYNQPVPKEAELVLIDSPHYFTNIDESGKGVFYDKADRLIGLKRHRLVGRSPLTFHHPLRSAPESNPRVWPLRFKGDLTLYLPDKEKEEILQKIKKGYSAMLHRFLRKFACR